LELLKRGDKKASQIERELGITPGLLVKWRARYQILEKEGEAVQLGPSDMEAAKAEIRRLQRELANVEEEREILKKVVNIFSRKSG
jgi:transposase